MTKRTILTLASGAAVAALGLGLAQSSHAQATLGCQVFAAVNTLAIGQAVQRTCSDGSATSGAQFISTDGLNKTFRLTANLKRPEALSASTNIRGTSGSLHCSGVEVPTDQNPSSGSVVTANCVAPVAQALNMRLLAGDGVGP